jgi:hypothetical protein
MWQRYFASSRSLHGSSSLPTIPVESLQPFVGWVERLRNPSLSGGVGNDGLRKRSTHPTRPNKNSANYGTDLALSAHIFNLGIAKTKIRFVL